MRLPRLRFTIRRMTIAVAVVAISVWAYTRYSWGWAYYAAGWWDAEQELWRGRATVYRPRSRYWSRDVRNVDEATGLPIWRVDVRWYKDSRERVTGHNDHIEQYIRWHGLPPNTLKPWVNELLNLRRYFEDRSKAEGPTRLHADGPPAFSPDGRSSVRLVPGVRYDGKPDDWLSVVVADENVVRDQGRILPERCDCDLLWGPEGSRIAILRSRSDQGDQYKAYDLRTGRLLRQESWDGIDGR